MKPMNTLRSHPKALIFFVMFFLFSSYTGMVYTQGTEKKPNSDAFRRGQMVWQNQNCQSCHQLYGLGGHKGPDLTNLMSDTHKGEMYARALIQSGTAEMPAFAMEKEDMDDLIIFLQEVDKSGQNRVPAHVVDRFGSYTLENDHEE